MSSKSAMGCELCLCIECPNHEEAFCLESIKSNVRKNHTKMMIAKANF